MFLSAKLMEKRRKEMDDNLNVLLGIEDEDGKEDLFPDTGGSEGNGTGEKNNGQSDPGNKDENGSDSNKEDPESKDESGDSRGEDPKENHDEEGNGEND